MKQFTDLMVSNSSIRRLRALFENSLILPLLGLVGVGALCFFEKFFMKPLTKLFWIDIMYLGFMGCLGGF